MTDPQDEFVDANEALEKIAVGINQAEFIVATIHSMNVVRDAMLQLGFPREALAKRAEDAANMMDFALGMQQGAELVRVMLLPEDQGEELPKAPL